MKTREQERQERRTSRAVWIVSTTIIAVWVACLLLSVHVHAAPVECQLEGVTTGQAFTGAIVWSWVLMRIIVRLDEPRKAGEKRNGTPAQPAGRCGPKK